MKQLARNACGTVALYHVLVNLFRDDASYFENDSFIKKFSEKNKDRDPE